MFGPRHIQFEFLKLALVRTFNEQSLKLAVMPADDSNGGDQATDFLEFVTTAYPDTADRWELFDSEGDFIELIRDENYSQAIGQDYVLPVFSTAIVFSSGGPNWEYTVRIGSWRGGGRSSLCGD